MGGRKRGPLGSDPHPLQGPQRENTGPSLLKRKEHKHTAMDKHLQDGNATDTFASTHHNNPVR